MFRRLTIAYTVNELGNWLGTIALSVAVFDHTHSAIATAALFVSVRFLPALVTTAAVTWLESLGRRGTLAALYAIQALTTGGLAALVLHPVLAPILVLGALDGVAALAARALLRAVVSQQAGDDSARRRANGYLNVGWATTAALGPAIGGVLTGVLGASSVLLIDVASFALTAALVLQVPISRTDTVRGGIFEQLGNVRRYITEDETLGWLLGTEAVALVFFAAVVPDRGHLREGDSRRRRRWLWSSSGGLGRRNAARKRDIRACRTQQPVCAPNRSARWGWRWPTSGSPRPVCSGSPVPFAS